MNIDAMREFFVSVESEFYAESDALYRQRVVERATERIAASSQLDSEDEEEDVA